MWEHRRVDAFELWCWRRLLRIPWTTRRPNQSILKEISPNIHWKDWCWDWNSNSLAIWWEKLSHWKRPWCWERLKAGGEGDDRGWDGWMASLTWWTWIWASSRSFDIQGSLVCCSLWGHKELDVNERLNWTEFVHCRMFSSIPCFYPLASSSSPHPSPVMTGWPNIFMTKNVSTHCKSPPPQQSVENYWCSNTVCGHVFSKEYVHGRIER